MELLFYQNDSNSLRIFLDKEGNYTLEVGDKENPDSLPLPEIYVENFPLSEEGVPSFIKKMRMSDSLLLQIVEKESDLINALRRIKCAEGEIPS